MDICHPALSPTTGCECVRSECDCWWWWWWRPWLWAWAPPPPLSPLWWWPPRWLPSSRALMDCRMPKMFLANCWNKRAQFVYRIELQLVFELIQVNTTFLDVHFVQNKITCVYFSGCVSLVHVCVCVCVWPGTSPIHSSLSRSHTSTKNKLVVVACCFSMNTLFFNPFWVGDLGGFERVEMRTLIFINAGSYTLPSAL